jgi:hypothetical protein
VVQFAELLSWCRKTTDLGNGVPPFPDHIVKSGCQSERLTIAAFCDQFSRYIAHHYHAGQLDFSVADTAMNALHAYVGNTYDVRLPSYAWEVFMAFDDGEHYHAHDPAGTDPEVKYTRAQIASLIIRESILGWSGAER